MSKSILIVCITFLHLALTSTNANARCDEYKVTIFPDQENMLKNSLIIINFSGSSSEIGKNINIKYPAFLTDGKKEIALELVEINSSALFMTQIVLRPSKKLKKGKKYSLRIDNIDATKFTIPNKSWNILDRTDEEIPKLLRQPKEVANSYDKKPEGIQKIVRFDIQYMDNSLVFIKCTLKDVSGAVINMHYLPIDKLGQISVGHNACFGAYELNENTSYYLDFQIMDICGNMGEILFKGIHFTSPKEPRVIYKRTTTIIEE